MRFHLPQIEAAITRVCVNSCAACNHAIPVAKPPYIMPLEVLREDLLRIGQVADIGQLALLGGEPLLHPDIDEMIAMARSTNVAKLVVIITNGQLLQRMTERFWRTIRKIDVDVYPGKLSGAQIVYIQRKARENHVDLRIFPVSTFYKCVRSGKDETPEHVQARFDRCPTGHLCTCVDYGHVYRCQQAFLWPPLFMPDQSPTVDGIPLDGITPEKLKAYLEGKTPLKSCRRCSVQEQYHNWHETTLDRWEKESTYEEA